MNKYRIKLKHDGGITTIVLMASSLDMAIENIITIEGCPKRAIFSVELV